MQEREKAFHAAMAAADRAVNKAEAATERRFESVNEFRSALSDQAATFMPRAEAHGRMDALSGRIADLKGRLDVAEGQLAAKNDSSSHLMAILSLVLSAVVAVVGGLSLILNRTANEEAVRQAREMIYQGGPPPPGLQRPPP
jgi:hypothetical protein